VFVKGAKENVLRDPSGITYAIPGRYVKALLEKAGLAGPGERASPPRPAGGMK
jgi:hypothetical protein